MTRRPRRTRRPRSSSRRPENRWFLRVLPSCASSSSCSSCFRALHSPLIRSITTARAWLDRVTRAGMEAPALAGPCTAVRTSPPWRRAESRMPPRIRTVTCTTRPFSRWRRRCRLRIARLRRRRSRDKAHRSSEAGPRRTDRIRNGCPACTACRPCTHRRVRRTSRSGPAGSSPCSRDGSSGSRSGSCRSRACRRARRTRRRPGQGACRCRSS